MRAPSGEKEALHTRVLMAAQRDDLLAGCRVGGGDDARPVGGEGRAPHRAIMAAQRDDLLAGRRVPEARRAVMGGGDDARPSLSPPPAGCRTRRGPRSPACASAATPSELIGPTRCEDRSIGSSRRKWRKIASRRTLKRHRLAKRHQIGPGAPRVCEPVGRRDGDATKRKRRRRGIRPASGIGVSARNPRRFGRETFRPQHGSASPPVAKPPGRGCSRPSSGMAAPARARLSDPSRGIRGYRQGDFATEAFELKQSSGFESDALACRGSAGCKGTSVPSARKIDVIVVYKLDRLTRSLADFAKLVEPFDIIEGAQPPLRPLHLVVRETEFCGLRLAGEFRRRTRENGGNSARRPRHASLTDRNCEGFRRPGNRGGLPGLHGGGRSPAKPVSATALA